jgi:hypothetical protein
MKKILLLIVLGFTISAFSQNRAKLFMGANNGGVNTDFVFTVKTDNAGTSANDQFAIPTRGSVGNYTVTTSDGTFASGLIGAHTITFPSGAGTYTVTISGDFPQIFFDNGGDRLKILSIENWGFYSSNNNQFSSFRGCQNMLINATDGGDFSNVTTWVDCFRDIDSVITFPLLNFNAGTSFQGVFVNSGALANFPANAFDNCLGTNFTNAFTNTNLTQTSIDGILVSIESNGTSGGTFSQSGGSAPSAIGETAIDALRTRGWTITVTGGY